MKRPSTKLIAALAISTLTVGATALCGSTAAMAAPIDNPPFPPYIFTGAPQSIPVPDNACSVDIIAEGASGGYSTDGTPGGLGARVVATVPVDGDDVVTFDIGGSGTYEWYEVNGGYGGGATGGAYITEGLRGAFAGGGGGRTLVSLNGTDLIVAGGGGGGGNSASGLTGGVGGAGAQAGSDGAQGLLEGGAGGSAGGTGGAGGTNAANAAFSQNGQSAAGSAGGAGGDSTSIFAGAGGGGGGGVIGGGGGASSALEGTDFLRSPGGGGGGAGSSMGPEGAVFSTRSAEGSGIVSLTFSDCDPADPETPATSAPAAPAASGVTGSPAAPAGPRTLAQTGAESTGIQLAVALAAAAAGLALLGARRFRRAR